MLYLNACVVPVFYASHSHEINAAASKSVYTIKPHYLPAIDKQRESSLKVCYGYVRMYVYINHLYSDMSCDHSRIKSLS